MRNVEQYNELKNYFMNRKDAFVVLTFEEMENIVQSKLPSSAYDESEAWFSNDSSHNQAHAWLDAGFETDCVMDTREIDLITFVRPSCIA